MRRRVSLKVARILITYDESALVHLREVRSPSGKYRIVFSLVTSPDIVADFTTDYLTSKTSHRFMCSLKSFSTFDSWKNCVPCQRLNH